MAGFISVGEWRGKTIAKKNSHKRVILSSCSSSDKWQKKNQSPLSTLLSRIWSSFMQDLEEMEDAWKGDSNS